MSLQSFVSEFLTFLEKLEERLLSWGFYNVRWLAADIEAGLETEAPEALRMDWQELEDAGHTVRSLLQHLQQRNLLYLVPGTIDAYRTRFAEGVRQQNASHAAPVSLARSCHRRYGTDSETTAHQTTAGCSNAAFWHSQQNLVAAPSTSQD